VFENGVLRRMFLSKRDEATGEWRKLHNEELHDLCPSPTIVRVRSEERRVGKECDCSCRSRGSAYP
jgi:hypothetical protein